MSYIKCCKGSTLMAASWEGLQLIPFFKTRAEYRRNDIMFDGKVSEMKDVFQLKILEKIAPKER